jgi:HK97 family phage portal protein
MINRPPSTGRYADRAATDDPRERIPNDNGAGPNVPAVSVGPTSSENAPGNFVMGAEAWSGWPDSDTPGGAWNTPLFEPMGAGQWSGEGYGRGMVEPGGFLSRISTAMTCTDLASRQLGSFPIYGLRGSAPAPLPEWRNNPEPEVYASWAEFVMGAVNSLLLRGECITYATGRYKRDDSVARFVTINPDLVDIELIDGRQVVSLGTEELDPADVRVVKWQTWPGRPRGITPLEWIGRSILTASALERYATNLANRGGVPWAVLKSPKNINASQAADAQARWVAAGKRRDGAPAVLNGEWELEPLTISPRDMALLELREFDERRICAAFGTPAYLVNVAMASGLTYTNAESLFRQHWTSLLRPMANLLASAWSAWLLPRGTTLEFNPDRYVQGTLSERALAWSTMFAIYDPVTGQRAITVDEIRAAERLQPVDEPADLSDAMTLTGGQV